MNINYNYQILTKIFLDKNQESCYNIVAYRRKRRSFFLVLISPSVSKKRLLDMGAKKKLFCIMKTIKIRIKDNKVKPYIVDKVYSYRHFENMYIILLQQDYNQKINDFDIFTNERVMRAVLTNNEGGKKKEEVNYIKEKYKDHSLMKDLIEVSKKLKIHNLVEIMKRVKSQYKGFFTKKQNGDNKAKPPNTRKLSKMNKYTIPLDSCNSFSVKKNNRIGVNLDKKMIYTHVNFTEVGKLTGGIGNINSIDLNFSNKDIYFLITHNKKDLTVSELPSPEGEGFLLQRPDLLSYSVQVDSRVEVLISTGVNSLRSVGMRGVYHA